MSCSFKENSKNPSIKGGNYTKSWAPGAGSHSGPFRSYPLFLVSKSKPQLHLESSAKHLQHAKHKAETPVLWPPHAKSWLIGKDFDAGRDWGQEVKGTTEDEMAGWHHWLDGRESEWTPAVGDGQGGLACYDSWGRKESDTTEQLNWTELKHISRYFLNSMFFEVAYILRGKN